MPVVVPYSNAMLRRTLFALLVILPALCPAADDVLSDSDRSALRQLGLQADQWQQIDQLVSSSEERIQALKTEEESISHDLHKISAGNGDAASIPTLARKRAALAADRMKVRAGIRTRLNDILTPQQSTQLRALLDQNVPVNAPKHEKGRGTPAGAWPSLP